METCIVSSRKNVEFSGLLRRQTGGLRMNVGASGEARTWD